MMSENTSTDTTKDAVAWLLRLAENNEPPGSGHAAAILMELAERGVRLGRMERHLRALFAAEDMPWRLNRSENAACAWCGVEEEYTGETTHEPDCAWIATRTFLSTISPEEPR